jgi:hypothetical protein
VVSPPTANRFSRPELICGLLRLLEVEKLATDPRPERSPFHAFAVSATNNQAHTPDRMGRTSKPLQVPRTFNSPNGPPFSWRTRHYVCRPPRHNLLARAPVRYLRTDRMRSTRSRSFSWRLSTFVFCFVLILHTYSALCTYAHNTPKVGCVNPVIYVGCDLSVLRYADYPNCTTTEIACQIA